MKAIIVYAFALAAIANGQAGLHVQSNAALENHREDPYGYLLRTRRNDEFVCTPGSTKQEDCNTCTCTSFGYGTEWSCTRMECPSEQSDYLNDGPFNPPQHTKRELGNRVGSPWKHLLRVVRSEQICEPGSTKQEDCNTCICTSFGSVAEWSCTRMECPSE